MIIHSHKYSNLQRNYLLIPANSRHSGGFSSLLRRRLESDADRCCGGDRRHSGGFLLRIMPPSWHPAPACTPRLRCRRAVLLCSNDGAASIPKSGLEIKNRCSLWAVLEGFFASIPKSGLEIKNRCTQQCINGENLASIRKSGLEIKNRCTQQCINGEILASILKSASRGFDSGGRAGADAPGGGISLCFCRRGCAAPAQKAATLNDHCRRGQSMERTVRSLPETVKWMFIPAKLRPYTL